MTWQVLQGDSLDVLRTLDAESVQTCITSPPYWGLRDYGSEGQLGLEPTPEQYVENLVSVFREVRRVLRDDGTLWLNLGDSYAGSWGNQGRKPERGTQRPINGPMLTPVHDGRHGDPNASNTGQTPPGLKPKDLVGIPWRVAFALQADGWWLRSDIIWSKPNPMPESVTDRPTRSHEYIFLLTKSARYVYDADAIREEFIEAGGQAMPRDVHGSAMARAGANGQPDRGNLGGYPQTQAGRNKRSVWSVTTQPFPGAHFATFPPKLIEPCILAGSPPDSTVLDPFAGSGTTGLVALRHNRDFIGIELSAEYAEMARDRIRDDAPLLNVGAEA